MNTPQPQQTSATEPTATTGRVTREMLRKRAVELAVGCGRSAQTLEKGDWEQAERELAMPTDETHPPPPVSGPALERWENEGGVVLDTADLTADPQETPANEAGQ